MDNRVNELLSKKRIYAVLIICLFVIGFIYWNEYNSNTDQLKSITWNGLTFFYLFLGLVFMAMRDFAYMVRLRVLTDNKLTWKQCFNVIMIWEFASAITPGVVGGSAVAIFILEKERIPIAKSTTLVIITLIFDNLFYILFIPFIFLNISMTTLFTRELNWFTTNGMTLFWIGYGILVFINLILVASVFIQPKIISSLVKLIYKLPLLKKRKAKGEQFAEDIKIASQNLKQKKAKFWVKIMATTCWSWLARFLVVNVVLAAFISLNLGDHLVILARQLVMWLGMLVSPTPGGSGVAELAFSGLFHDYISSIGVSAIALALIWRTLSYYPYLLIGAILLPKWLRKKK